MFAESTYLAHRLALEGRVFYYNELTEKQHVQKFFPVAPGEDKTYDVDPKISFPITSDILNNFASLLYRESVIKIDPPSLQPRLDEFLALNNWTSLGRELLVRTLFGGTLLAVIRPMQLRARIELWGGEWTFVGADELHGYTYKVCDGKRVPLTSKPDKEDDVRLVPITDTIWGEFEHGFGFNPSVMFFAPDVQDDSPYPMPFHMRYRQQNIEYNLLWSQMILNSRVLQNVWVTNKDRKDPNNPVMLRPRFINYLGENGTLAQVRREMNIDAELTLIEKLKQHIAESAQVPSFMTGLDGVGKVESGVAMSIVFAPLVHITNRLKSEFRPKFIELITKGLVADYMLNEGHFPPDFAIDLQFTDNVIPIDRGKELETIQRADAMGVFTPEEKRKLILPLFGLEVTNDDVIGRG